MSDERLREAERRWRETRAVEDEARYLLERVRVGNLTQERLELAAYCGQPGAALAVALDPLRVATAHDARRWVLGLERWGKEAYVRAALAAYESRPDCCATELVGAVHDWLECPCDLHADGVRDAPERDAPSSFLRQAVIESPQLLHSWTVRPSGVEFAASCVSYTANPAATHDTICHALGSWAVLAPSH